MFVFSLERSVLVEIYHQRAKERKETVRIGSFQQYGICIRLVRTCLLHLGIKKNVRWYVFFWRKKLGHVQYRCIFFRTRTYDYTYAGSTKFQKFQQRICFTNWSCDSRVGVCCLMNNHRMVNNQRVQLSQR